MGPWWSAAKGRQCDPFFRTAVLGSIGALSCHPTVVGMAVGARAQVGSADTVDSISTLCMLSKLTSKGSGVGLIAREVALVLAESNTSPEFVRHIPGAQNVWPDALS
eukprot:6065877-Amphidinium_carterae.1